MTGIKTWSWWLNAQNYQRKFSSFKDRVEFQGTVNLHLTYSVCSDCPPYFPHGEKDLMMMYVETDTTYDITFYCAVLSWN